MRLSAMRTHAVEFAGVAMLMVLAWPVARAQSAPSNQAAVVALARQLETAVSKNDVVGAQATFDLDACLDRAMAGVSVSPAFAAGFRHGVRRDSPIIGSLIKGAKGGTYRF